jgi:hypothetical protein
MSLLALRDDSKILVWIPDHVGGLTGVDAILPLVRVEY